MLDADPDGLQTSSITVSVRVRPFTSVEQSHFVPTLDDPSYLSGASVLDHRSDLPVAHNPLSVRNVISVVDNRMLIFDPPVSSKCSSRLGERRFVFDHVFDSAADQIEVYTQTAKPLLSSVLEGYNSTIFAYGATGCGKTHTILGTPSAPGVISLMLSDLYQRLDDIKDTTTAEISVQFLEIYNETIKDLLDPSTNPKLLIIREDSKNLTLVSNLLSHSPSLVDEVMQLVTIGNSNRTTSHTEANATSSRSHAVLQINIIQRNRTADVDEEHLLSTLSIIDLAGLERAASTKNRGARLQEGANINRLLLALGNCINALCDPRRRNHIPFRDSKLTRLLKFSLGGNCKTVMIVCVSPLLKHHDETFNTLKYADRAKKIRTKTSRNQQHVSRHVRQYLKIIHEQKQEIEELRARELNNRSQNRIVQIDVERQVLEQVALLRQDILEQTQEKWHRYFILAKRKMLFLQRVEVSRIGESCDANIKDLCESLITRLDHQILMLEMDFSQPSVFDTLLRDCQEQSQLLITKSTNSSSALSYFFQEAIGNIEQALERDFLFGSSILFEHFILRMVRFSLVGVKTDDDLKRHLESLCNREFDTALDECAAAFIETQVSTTADLPNPIAGGDVSPNDSVIYTPHQRKRQETPYEAEHTRTPEHSPKRRLARAGPDYQTHANSLINGKEDTMDSTMDIMGGEPALISRTLLGGLSSPLVSPPLPSLGGYPSPPTLLSGPPGRVQPPVVHSPEMYSNRRLSVHLGNKNHEEVRLADFRRGFPSDFELSSSPTQLPKLNMQACVRVALSSDMDTTSN